MERILFISSRFPYPPLGGDTLKNFNLIKILSKYYLIDLISIHTESINYEQRQFLKKYTDTAILFRKSKWDFVKSAAAVLFNKLPLQVNYYYFKDIQDCVDRCISEKAYKFLFSSLIRTTRYFEAYESKIRIVDMADSIGLNYQNSQKKVRSIFWKLIYGFETKRLLKYEQEVSRNYTLNFFVNPKEIKCFKGNTFLLQNGVNYHELSKMQENVEFSDTIVFFGNLKAQHNIDTVLWIVDNVLPLINKDIKFCIVGANPTRKILDLRNKYSQVVVTGF